MRALDLFLSSASLLGELHPKTRRIAAQTELLASDVPYSNSTSRAHTLDIHAPKGDHSNLPVILFVHGGGFRILSKNSHRALARRFAAAGYLVVNINYRLTPAGRYPNALKDVCQALLWTLDHAGDFGGDCSRLAYAGESAGGNLTLCAALLGWFELDEPWAKEVFERNPSPKAVLPACGLLEVHHAERYLDNKRLPRWLRARIKLICEGYLGDAPIGSLASPLHLLESARQPTRPLPPIFAICGGIDPILDDTERLGRCLQTRANAGGIKLYAGSHHAFHAFFGRNADAAWTDQLTFLHEHLHANA